MAAPLRVHTFSPAWGLPTGGPFGLKLLSWLRLAGIDHEVVHEDNSRKGPKGKSPWIEDGTVRIGDTSLIIDYLRQKHGTDPDAAATAAQRAHDLALRRMLEEHTHQVLEYELFVDDRGWEHARKLFSSLPPVARSVVPRLVRTMVRRQLHARGVGRHAPGDIARMGVADVEAVLESLAEAPFLGGASPRSVDASAFGMLGLLGYSPLETPVASRIRATPELMAYLDRLRARWFPA